MIIIIISFSISILYIIMLIFKKSHDRTGPDKGQILDTVNVVRIFYLTALCVVPGLCFMATVLNRNRLFMVAESAVPIVSLALFMMGISTLGQRSLAKRFKMHVAFELREIIIMTVIPALLYLSFIPATDVTLYYASPGLYAGFLAAYIIKKRKKT